MESSPLVRPRQCFFFPDDKAIKRMSRILGIDFEYDHEQARLLLGALSQPLPPGWTQFVNPSGDFYYVKDDLNVTDVDPRLDSCKEKIKELERELAIEEKMKLQSVVNSSENMPNFNKLAQTNKTNVLPKLLQQAYTFYVGLYGDPDTEDIQPSDTVPRFFDVSPEQVVTCAASTFGLSLPDELPLLWIVRQFLASPLPPRWSKDRTFAEKEHEQGTFKIADGDDGAWIMHENHPGIEYFEKLLESVREEVILQDEEYLVQDTEDFRNGLLQFIKDQSGKLYVHDFYTGETTFAVTTESDNDTNSDEQKHEDIVKCGSSSVGSSAGSDAENCIKLMTKDELDALLLKDNKSIWKVVTERVPKQDFYDYLKAIGVIPRRENTEFLTDIARTLLSLPIDWIRRKDHDGKLHYCSKTSLPVSAMLSHSDSVSRRHQALTVKMKDLECPSCDWASTPNHRAVALDLLEFYLSSANHPLAASERLRLTRKRELLSQKEALARIKKRNDDSLEALRKRISRSKQVLRTETTSPHASPQQIAYEYYVRIFGQPGAASCATLSARVTEDEIIQTAFQHGINASEHPYLLWIIQAKLSSNLPPGWVQSGSRYVMDPGKSSEFETAMHPNEVYFAAVLYCECTKVRKLSRSKRLALQKYSSLEFINPAGRTYYFDFFTGRRSFALSKASRLIKQAAPFIISQPVESGKSRSSRENVSYDDAKQMRDCIAAEGLGLDEMKIYPTEERDTAERYSSKEQLQKAQPKLHTNVGHYIKRTESQSSLSHAVVCTTQSAVVKIRDKHVKEFLGSVCDEEDLF